MITDTLQDGEIRKAEILSIQTRKGAPTFYVHYDEFNKRLDEWVVADRIDLSQEVEWPLPEKPDAKNKQKSNQNQQSKNQLQVPGEQERRDHKKRSRAVSSDESRDASATPLDISAKTSRRPSFQGGKENRDPNIAVFATEDILGGGTPQPEDDSTVDLVDMQDAAAAAKAVPSHVPYSREEEIEKLRTGGSMTQNQTEISRVRNLERVQMGSFEIEPWYFSPYPAEFADCDMVYICEFCL